MGRCSNSDEYKRDVARCSLQFHKTLNMDMFGYNAAVNEEARVARSPERDELREVVDHLRGRYGRRRVFRVAEVEDAVRYVRYGDVAVDLDPPTPQYSAAADVVDTPDYVAGFESDEAESGQHPTPEDDDNQVVPVIDLTCDEVL